MASAMQNRNWTALAAIALSAVAIVFSLSPRDGNTAVAGGVGTTDLSSVQVVMGFDGFLVFDAKTGNLFGYKEDANPPKFLGRITEPGRPLDLSPHYLVDQMIAEKNVKGLNEIAWAIVDPKGSSKNRDYAFALRAASKANELSDGKDAVILDTLARCYSVTGDRQKAIEYQKKAVASLGPKDERNRAEIEETLRYYESIGR